MGLFSRSVRLPETVTNAQRSGSRQLAREQRANTVAAARQAGRGSRSIGSPKPTTRGRHDGQ